jgi:hypothetical protein
VQEIANRLSVELGPAISDFSDKFVKAVPPVAQALGALAQSIAAVLIPPMKELVRQAGAVSVELGKIAAPATTLAQKLGGLKFAADAVVIVFRYSLNPYNALRLQLMAVDLATRGATAAFNAVRAAAQTVAGVFMGGLSGAMVAVRAVTGGASTSAHGLENAFDAVKGAAQGVAGVVRGALGGALSGFRGVATAITSVMNALASALRAVASAARSVASALSSIHVPSIHLPDLNPLHHFAEGGIVPGRLGAPMLAMVHGGETITPPGRGGALFGASGGGGGVFEVHFHGGTFIGGDRERLAREIATSIRDELVRVGQRNAGGIFGGQA